jgi:basic membrane protein A
LAAGAVGVVVGAAGGYYAAAPAARMGNQTQTVIQTVAPQQMKLALITQGKINDSGWGQLGYEAIQSIEKTLKWQVTYSEGVQAADYDRFARTYAEQGTNLILAHEFVYIDPTYSIAPDYPNVDFACTKGYKVFPNVSAYDIYTHETSYLIGILAGKLTKSNTVGYVGGMESPDTRRCCEGFKMGVKSVNPNANTLEVITGDWYDMSKGKEAALSEIDAGADFIDQDAAVTGIGAIQACKEKNVLCCGSLTDCHNLAPNVVLTSSVWDFSPLFQRIAADVQVGLFKGSFYVASLSLGQAVHLAPYYNLADRIPDDVKMLVEQKTADIISNKLVIPRIDYKP